MATLTTGWPTYNSQHAHQFCPPLMVCPSKICSNFKVSTIGEEWNWLEVCMKFFAWNLLILTHTVLTKANVDLGFGEMQFYSSMKVLKVLQWNQCIPPLLLPPPNAFVIAHQQWIQIDESTENLKEKKSATTKWDISASKVRSSSTQSISLLQES